MRPLVTAAGLAVSAVALAVAAWLWAHPDPGEMVRVRRDGG